MTIKDRVKWFWWFIAAPVTMLVEWAGSLRAGMLRSIATVVLIMVLGFSMGRYEFDPAVKPWHNGWFLFGTFAIFAMFTLILGANWLSAKFSQFEIEVGARKAEAEAISVTAEAEIAKAKAVEKIVPDDPDA